MPLPLHSRKKLEVIIERAGVKQALDALDRAGVRGYTMIPHAEGSGQHGRRERDDLLGVLDNVLIIAVATPEAVEAVLEDLHALLIDYVGVVFVSDVDVLRPERF